MEKEMLAFKLENNELEQDFREIVQKNYENNFDLALTDAIERFVSSQKMKNREVMLELVKKFREKNKRKSQTEIDKIIENTVKDYREK
jgi:hypothetical protein